MRIIQTDLLTPEAIGRLGETEKLWIYNGLDCCITFEVADALRPQFTNLTRSTYEFEKALQGPILEMNLHGVAVNLQRRDEAIAAFQIDIDRISANLKRLFIESFDRDFNHRSPAQLKEFFYTVLRIPAIKKRNAKGEYAPTVDRDALEQLTKYYDAEIFCNHILALRDLEKKVSALKSTVDPDKRIRTSYNIGGTNTGRLSSSESVFGTGGNMQNIEDRLRIIYEADKGMKLAYVDLEQAESRAVGAICYNIFNKSTYLDACESGDLHTSVVKMCWPNMGWTEDLKADKALAEQPFYRQHSYRHMCKVLGHGSNYLGTPYTMAKHTKIERRAVADFQGVYFKGFPEIPMWHNYVRTTIQVDGKLVSLMGRVRHFFGRRNDDSTIREAVAFDPQSSVADILNTALLRIWRARICQVLLQIHDAILIQYPEYLENEILPQILEMMKVPIELRNGRVLIIPSEAQVGWNWAKASDKNPDGLIKFNGNDTRTRTAPTLIMDEIVR